MVVLSGEFWHYPEIYVEGVSLQLNIFMISQGGVLLAPVKKPKIWFYTRCRNFVGKIRGVHGCRRESGRTDLASLNFPRQAQ